MNQAKFNVSLKEVQTILEKTDFLRQVSCKPVNKEGVSDEFKIASQRGNYFEIYNTAVKNFDYDFLLFDQSFFQFEHKIKDGKPYLRFAFFQNPQEFKSYEEYIDILKQNKIIDSEDEIGDIFLSEYEQFLNETLINLSSTTIRYDLDYNDYRPLVHSVSHFHIGHSNSIRIPVDKIISPRQFTLFIIKHIYFNIWSNFIESENKAIIENLELNKNDCENVNKMFWNINEEKELYIK